MLQIGFTVNNSTMANHEMLKYHQMCTLIQEYTKFLIRKVDSFLVILINMNMSSAMYRWLTVFGAV